MGENVDTSGFRDDGGLGVGWEILRAGQRGEGGGIFRLLSLVFCLELDTPSGGSRSALRGHGFHVYIRLREEGAQVRSGFGRGLRYALAASGRGNLRNTRKRAQFWIGFGRCLLCALVASSCENGRTTRKSAYFMQPGARAKILKYRVKKRAKNAKNGGVKIASW